MFVLLFVLRNIRKLSANYEYDFSLPSFPVFDGLIFLALLLTISNHDSLGAGFSEVRPVWTR